jgi:hypothetical protein
MVSKRLLEASITALKDEVKELRAVVGEDLEYEVWVRNDHFNFATSTTPRPDRTGSLLTKGEFYLRSPGLWEVKVYKTSERPPDQLFEATLIHTGQTAIGATEEEAKKKVLGW